MLGFGALGEFPLADFGTTPPPVSVSLPTVAIAFAALSAALHAGKNFDGPSVSVTIAAPTPAVLAGKHVNLPIVAISVDLPQAGALAGNNVDLPAVMLEFLAFMPDIQTGRILNLANTFTVITDGLGALGEGALGEFVIGDGESVSATYTRPIQLRLHATDAAAHTGKNFGTPPIPLSLVAPVIEVDARRRPIRINAIAS